MAYIMKNRATLPSMIITGLMLATPAHAALFQGEALDKVAEIVSWAALVIAPLTLISLFWFVHILPEKVAEKKHHPQTKAIQVLCLLSLVFGGLLWPFALIWAYSKPVMYKMAYGKDTLHHEPAAAETAQAAAPDEPASEGELDLLRAKVAALEARLADRQGTR